MRFAKFSPPTPSCWCSRESRSSSRSEAALASSPETLCDEVPGATSFLQSLRRWTPPIAQTRPNAALGPVSRTVVAGDQLFRRGTTGARRGSPKAGFAERIRRRPPELLYRAAGPLPHATGVGERAAPRQEKQS